MTALAAPAAPARLTPVGARTWTMTLTDGSTATGPAYSWCEECRTSSHDETDLTPRQLGVRLADLTHNAVFPGFKVTVFEDCHGTYTTELLCGRIHSTPHPEDDRGQAPLVDLQVTETTWIENLGPAELADVAAKLRAQADRLDQAHARLVAARTEWEAQL